MKAPRWLSYVAFPLFIAAILALIWAFRQNFVEAFRDREVIRSWVLARGAAGMLAFVGIQALQVILFMLPGEIVQVAGGYAFGLWLGSLLSLVGITLGSLVNFGVGRVLGRPFVESVFGAEKVGRLERIAASGKGEAGFFIFFLVPGIPKDALCYVAGMARLSLPAFLAVSMAGRLPGILGSSYMGSATQAGGYRGALVMLGIASLLFVLGLVFKERIEGWVEGLLHRRKGGDPL
jgi:uncharacterized membrane protein YdjX (TVP38/TMEM64 family)